MGNKTSTRPTKTKMEAEAHQNAESREETEKDVPEDDVNILLMGLKNQGITSTAKSILLARDGEDIQGDSESSSTDYNANKATIDGRSVQVVDLPGFDDTDGDTSALKKQINRVVLAMDRAMVRFPDGFNTVVFVIQYRTQLTLEIRESMHLLIRLFDEKAFRMKCIPVISYGDNFEHDLGSDVTVREWLAQSSLECRWLLDLCGKRCVLFDNETRDENKQKAQVRELLALIDGLDNGNARYMPSIVSYSGKDKDKFIKERQRLVQVERVSSLQSFFNEEVYKTVRVPIRQRVKRLKRVKDDANFLLDLVECVSSGSCPQDKMSTCLKQIDKTIADPSPENTKKLENEVFKLTTTGEEDLSKNKDSSCWTKFKTKCKEMISEWFTIKNILKAVGVVTTIVLFFLKK